MSITVRGNNKVKEAIEKLEAIYNKQTNTRGVVAVAVVAAVAFVASNGVNLTLAIGG